VRASATATHTHHLATWLTAAALVVLVYLLSVAPMNCLMMRDTKYHKYQRTFEVFSFPYGGFKYYNTPVKHLLSKYERWWFVQLVLPPGHSFPPPP
jgi:hypothetical protein